MLHPKMKHTYVGIDSHKDTHTAVFIDCFFEKLGEISFQNLPSLFHEFLENAEKYKVDGTSFLFGLEDVSMYGRTLTNFLQSNGQQVKHVGALLVALERKHSNTLQKTDSVDAECAARVLLSKFSELPEPVSQDKYTVLRNLVIRRVFIIKNNVALKNSLHNLLMYNYPNYRDFFGNIDCKTSLAFYSEYPSPGRLKNVTHDELTTFLYATSQGKINSLKAQEILDSLQNTTVEHQEIRDEMIQSTIRQIRFNLDEIKHIEKMMDSFLIEFDCTLTTMTGISTATAAHLLSCIGDVRRFSSAAKLARYSGVAPITYASGKKDLQFANQRGNRELNSLFFDLAVRISACVSPKRTVLNPFFYEYYQKKLSEGKTKRQALKCVQRRLINIIWGMLTHKKVYLNPEMYQEPKKEKTESEKQETS